MTGGKSPERRVVMPAGAFKFLKSDIRQKCVGAKIPNDGLSCPQGPLNLSKTTSGKLIGGKSPERRVVMPAGAFKFLENDIRQKTLTKARNDGLSCPQGPLNFSKMLSGENDLGQKPRTTGCHARRGL